MDDPLLPEPSFLCKKNIEWARNLGCVCLCGGVKDRTPTYPALKRSATLLRARRSLRTITICKIKRLTELWSGFQQHFRKSSSKISAFCNSFECFSANIALLKISEIQMKDHVHFWETLLTLQAILQKTKKYLPFATIMNLLKRRLRKRGRLKKENVIEGT